MTEIGTRATGSPPLPFAFCAPGDRQAILWAAILASSMGFIDSSVTSIAIPAIREALRASLPEVQWIGAGYLLALSSLVLAGGALGDRFGTARVFSAGIWLFVITSLACAAATTPEQLIAARTLKGVGAALMVPGSMALVARAFPREERGRALGLWAAASTATTAFGPVLGGALITWGGEAGWRAIFALNLPLGLISLWLIRGRTPGDKGSPGQAVDWVGAVLATAGLTSLAYTLTATAGPVWPYALAAVTCGAGFVIWEARAPAPMIRLGLFRNPGFALTTVVTLALYFALNGVMFYLPMTAVSVWGVTAVEVTAAFLPISVLIGVLSAPAGRWADQIGAGPLMAAGSALVALAYGGLALVAARGQFWAEIVPLMALAGTGLGLVVAPLTAAVMAGASEGEQGAASGINNAVARVAGLLAVALLGKLASLAYGAPGADLPGFGLPGADPAHLAATSAAFARVALVGAVMAAVAAALSLSMGRQMTARR